MDEGFRQNGEPLDITIRMDKQYAQAPGAFKVHGIPPYEGTDYSMARAVVGTYLARYKLCGYQLMGRNVAGFDAIMLRRLLTEDALDDGGEAVWDACDYHMKCSYAVQAILQDLGFLPKGRLHLNELARLLNVAVPEKLHRALPDALLETNVMRAMMALLHERVR